MKHFFKTTIWFLLLLTLPVVGFSQRHIKLSKANSNKEVILNEGMRVVYSTKTNPKSSVGILQSIQSDLIVIDNTPVSISDLKTLGKRKKGSGFWSALIAASGGAMIGAALSPDPNPCPSCQTVSVDDDGGTAGDVLFVTAGLTLVVLAINKAAKNAPKNISNGQWKLEVVE